MPVIKVLGFDPSFTNWGTAEALIDTSTLKITIVNLSLTSTAPEKGGKVRKSSDRLARAQILSNHVKEICVGQQLIFSEVPTGSQSAVAAMGLGVAVGVLASASAPVIQVTPVEVKKATVGKSNASKEAMIDWAVHKHPGANWLTKKSKGELVLTKANEHLADAIAVIYTGIQTDQFRQLAMLYANSAALNPIQKPSKVQM